MKEKKWVDHGTTRRSSHSPRGNNAFTSKMKGSKALEKKGNRKGGGEEGQFSVRYWGNRREGFTIEEQRGGTRGRHISRTHGS